MFDILPEIIVEYQTYKAKLFHFLSFCAFIYICLIKIEAFCTKNEDFDQIYLNTGSKTLTVEKLSLGLIFYNNFW